MVAGQRTTTIEWHSVLRLIVKVAEPMRLTVYQYDSNGNLTDTIEQATLDTTGAQGLTPVVTGPIRKTSIAYNAVGQVLRQTEFKRGIEQITRYQYNLLDGNLESIVAPNGTITRYANYNAHGDVGRIETANGQITEITYNPRRWIKSVSYFGNGENRADNLSILYDYDSRGRILRETHSTGNIKIHNYDDAGRLISLTDSQSNRIELILDPKGNRLLEQVRDANGNLTNQTRRTIDPLGRLLQTHSGMPAPVLEAPTQYNIMRSK